MRFANIGPRVTMVLFMALLAGCGSEKMLVPPVELPPQQLLGTQTVTLTAGATSAEYYGVVVNTSLTGTEKGTYSVKADGAGPAPYLGFVPAMTALRVGTDGSSGMGEPQLDRAFEARLRARERAELTPLFGAARAWYAARSAANGASGSGFSPSRSNQAIPAGTKVGDFVRVNVNGNEACTNPVYHGARVAAIGRRALILDDTLNPKGGFTDADFQRFAARFDSLVYPLDSAAFGAPTDIDNNGHIALVFSRSVNELTPIGSQSYVGGFTFSRDLFPLVGTTRLEACAASNEGEYFYLLTPDPLGVVNGNKRSTGFVDSVTTGVIAHEFEHLINGGRKLYVNTASSSFEEKWLDEGLAHIAEELLFYRESGLSSRSNLGISELRTSATTKTAYNLDMTGNAGRYRSFLQAPSSSSPYAKNDSLSTRGAAWSLLRYLADRSAPSDGDIFFKLANNGPVGVANATAVFGAGFPGFVRDWLVSHAVDDIVATPEYQQRSWNWHSIYPNLGAGGFPYPLAVQSMANATPYTGTVLSGGAAYFKLTVPANGSATVVLTETAGASGNMLTLVTVKSR